MSTAVEQPTKRKGGAPKRNRNRLRHGLYSGRSPRGCTYIDRQAGQYRRALEDAVVAVHGEISIHHAGLVQTACEAVKHAMKAQAWQREGWGEMDWTTRLTFSREAVKALERRDTAVKALELSRDASEDLAAVLYGNPVKVTSGGHSDDVAGNSGDEDHHNNHDDHHDGNSTAAAADADGDGGGAAAVEHSTENEAASGEPAEPSGPAAAAAPVNDDANDGGE